MDKEGNGVRMYSRRDFLRGVPIGVAGAFVLSIFSEGLLSKVLKRRRRMAGFPKDSIFTPAKDQHEI